jgi:hypothetical protein
LKRPNLSLDEYLNEVNFLLDHLRGHWWARILRVAANRSYGVHSRLVRFLARRLPGPNWSER